MSEKLTDWFKPNVKPELPGVYETNPYTRPCKTYQYWDGKGWGSYNNDVHGAYLDRRTPSDYQSPKWRGLAEKPEA